MNRKQILETYKNIVDKEGVFLKTIDQIQSVIKYYEPQVTDFLSPEMCVVAEDLINFEQGIIYEVHSGIEDAERSRLEILPDYLTPSSDDAFIIGIRATYQQKFNTLSHRDALGAVLGLGISRQKIGDIIVTDEHIDFIVAIDISDYIVMALDKVGRAGVKVKKIPLSEISAKEVILTYSNDTVKSLRLDSIIASGYKCSRSEAKQWIDSQKVRVNHRMAIQASQDVKAGDLISVRSKGRIILNEVEGTTKKDRIRIKIAKYSS